MESIFWMKIERLKLMCAHASVCSPCVFVGLKGIMRTDGGVGVCRGGVGTCGDLQAPLMYCLLVLFFSRALFIIPALAMTFTLPT